MADKKKPWEYDDEVKPSSPVPPPAAQAAPWEYGDEPVGDTSRMNPWERMEATGLPWERGKQLPVRSLQTKGGLFERPVEPNTSAPLLPMSYDAEGKPQWDSNAGMLGDVKRFFETTHDARLGKVDPKTDPESIHNANAMAALMGGGGVGKAATVAARKAAPHVTGAFHALPRTFGFGARNMAGFEPVASSAPNLMFGARARGPVVPTTEELRARAVSNPAATGYDDLTRRGINYALPAIGQQLDDAAQYTMTGVRGPNSIPTFAIPPVAAPKTFGMIDQVKKSLADAQQSLSSDPAAQANMPYAFLDAARRFFSKTRKDPNPDERVAAHRALESTEDFMGRNAPGDLAPGSASAAGVAEALATNAGNYGAAARSGAVEEIRDLSTVKARRANSGLNFDNKSRELLDRYVTAKEGRNVLGWTPEEAALANKRVEGGVGLNVLRGISNFMGGGGGLGALHGAGHGAAAGFLGGGPFGALLGAVVSPTVGVGLKFAENAIAKRQMGDVASKLRERSPMFRERAEAARQNPTFTDPWVKALAARASLAGTRNPAWAEDEEMKRRIARGEVI